MFPPPYYAQQYFAAKYFANSAPTGPVECEFDAHPYGHIPIGVNQPLGGSLYPFINDDGDSPHTLIADLSLTYTDDAKLLVPPFRVAWLYGFGCYDVDVPGSADVEHARDLCIVDANDEVVVATGSVDVTYRERAWTEHQLICEWLADDYAVQLVHATAWADGMTPVVQPNFLAPTNAVIDPRTYHRMPPRLRSLRVAGQPALTSQVVLRSGYNAKLTASTKTAAQRRQTSVKFDFTPGSGDGRVPADCSTAQPAIRRIAGVTPDALQNLQLQASGCYTAERNITQIVSEESVTQARRVRVQRGLRLYGNCGPLCACSDYASVYEALRRLVTTANETWARLTTARELHRDNTQRFLAQKECREGAPKLLIEAAAYSPCQVGVTVAYCNQTDDCVQNVVLHVSFEYADDENCGVPVTSHPTSADVVSVNCNSVFRGGYLDPLKRRPVARETYKLHGTYPHYWGVLPYIPARGQGYLSFSVDIDDAECEAGAKMRFVADAYELPVVENAGDGSPVPGYIVGSGPTASSLQYRLVDCPVRKVVVLKTGCVDGVIPGTSTSTTLPPTTTGTTNPTTTTTVTTTGTTGACGTCDVAACVEYTFPEVPFGGGPDCLAVVATTRGPFSGRLTADELALECANGDSVVIPMEDPHATMTLERQLDGTWEITVVVTASATSLCPSTARYSAPTCTGPFTLVEGSPFGAGIAVEAWPASISATEISCDEPTCDCDDSALPDPSGYNIGDTIAIPCVGSASSSGTTSGGGGGGGGDLNSSTTGDGVSACLCCEDTLWITVPDAFDVDGWEAYTSVGTHGLSRVEPADYSAYEVVSGYAVAYATCNGSAWSLQLNVELRRYVDGAGWGYRTVIAVYTKTGVSCVGTYAFVSATYSENGGVPAPYAGPTASQVTATCNP